MKTQRKKGIVCFVDILGYSVFMKNNDVGENLINLLQIMNEIPPKIKPKIKQVLKEGGQSAIDKELFEMIDRVEHIMISDSILISMELSVFDDKLIEGMQWGIFIWYLSQLQKDFLDYGMPLRGAVSYGEYVTVDHSFAGKPIITSYEKALSINSIGIIIDEICQIEILEYLKIDKDYFRDMLRLNKLEFINKDKVKNEGYFISPIFPYSEIEREKLQKNQELTIYLTSAFTAHNKSLDDKAHEKLLNSINLYSQNFE